MYVGVYGGGLQPILKPLTFPTPRHCLNCKHGRLIKKKDLTIKSTCARAPGVIVTVTFEMYTSHGT